jgi:hypothetical protein
MISICFRQNRPPYLRRADLHTERQIGKSMYWRRQKGDSQRIAQKTGQVLDVRFGMLDTIKLSVRMPDAETWVTLAIE